MTDVLIVGAGPAGLGAAHVLHTRYPELSVMLVDAGRSYHRRFCPVDLGRRCRGCGGICNVVSGFGGSMHYGDGVKLSLMPSGRRLVDLFGEDDAYSLSIDAFQLITAYLDEPPPLVGDRVGDHVLETFASHNLALRQYPVAVLAESELRRALEGMYETLRDEVDFRFEVEVTDVQPDDEGYLVTLQSKRIGQRVHADTVVFATGRRGITRTQDILRRLGVPMTPPDMSCGVRFEMKADYLRATGLSHPDMKVTQREAGTNKIKTFCFCGGTNGGRVKFTHYQNAFGTQIITLDGHETLERVSNGRPLAGNFGLLCQTRRLDADAGHDEYLQREVIEPYRRLSDGRPIVQTFAEFRARREPAETWEALSDRLPFEPSVRDLQTAPVHSLFTDPQLDSLVTGFEKVMRPMLELGCFNSSVDDLADEILVIGLEIEFLWSHVAVDSWMETSRRNVFVTGDAAGIAQGVIQAMMTGIRAARSIGAESAARDVPALRREAAVGFGS